MSLGGRIKTIRVNRKQTLEEFANAVREKVGDTFKTSKNNVSKWERDDNVPNDIVLKAIADIAGISVEELVSDTCHWRKTEDKEIHWRWVTECNHSLVEYHTNRVVGNFEYCPFCGRRISCNSKEVITSD